jgi:hypothetical protein
MPELEPLFILPPDNPPDAEVRQLKLTIAALRQALEESTAARDELSRTIRAGYDSEISQLSRPSQRGARSLNRWGMKPKKRL